MADAHIRAELERIQSELTDLCARLGDEADCDLPYHVRGAIWELREALAQLPPAR